MKMSFPTFCKFFQLEKCVIAKQFNGVAAENDASHATWSFSPRDLEDHSGVFDMNSWMLGNYLATVRQDMQDMLHRCHLYIEISGGYVEDVDA